MTTEKQQPKRHILVAVSGNTPQIVTETLFALMIKNKPPVRIAEVYILTTERGRQIAWKGLGGAEGAITRFCCNYGIEPEIKFPYKNIYVFERNGEPLADIRTSQDNQILQSQLLAFVKTLTEDDNTVLHCSMGGGRRTMSAYMMLALTIYGRKQDSLTHVLVNEAFETNSDFFFPLKKNEKLAVRGANGKLVVVDTKDHQIELAEIPFVRLRKLYGANINDLEADIEKMVELAQVEIERTQPVPDSLRIDFKRKRADFGLQKIELRGVLLSLFVYFALLKKDCAHADGRCLECYQAPHEIDIKSFIEIHRRLKGSNEDQEKTWRNKGLSFLSYRNRINKKVKEIDAALEITKEDKNGAVYGLRLDRERIEIDV